MDVKCTQCGGQIVLQEGAAFITCPYCSSALYLDRSQVVFHFVVRPNVTPEEARGNLKRWMAGNDTVKDLDKLAVVENEELIYFPMWRFVALENGADKEYTELACAFAVPDIKKIPLSGGDLKFFDPKEFAGAPLKSPDVLLESALTWLQQRGTSREAVKETNLIHIPFYLFKYRFRGEVYQAVVAGSSGQVLASVYPPKAELPFYGIAVIATAVFFLEGVLAPGFLIRLALYIATAIPLAGLSYWVARRY